MNERNIVYCAVLWQESDSQRRDMESLRQK